MTTTTTATQTLKTLRFGIEIEMNNVSRAVIVNAIVAAMSGWTRTGQGYYSAPFAAVMPDGRKWTCVTDGSVANGCELVSPILTYADMETLQELVRVCRRAGGQAHSSCGIHVHVDGARFKQDPQAIRRLACNLRKDEDIYFAMLCTADSRKRQWCKPVNEAFFQAIKDYKGSELKTIESRWYSACGYSNVRAARSERYNNSRYHALNLHALWYRGTVEFRWFEASMHAGQVKSFVQLALAIAAKALDSKRATTRKRSFDPANAKFDAHHLCHALGLTGDEFKTARLHMTKHLGGTHNGRRVSNG